MNRKDIIIISVLVNTALLAVLFITATQSDEESSSKEEVIRTAVAHPQPQPVVEQPVFNPQMEMEPYLADSQPPLDEVDHVLRDYVPEEGLPLELAQEHQVVPDAPPPETPKPMPKPTVPESYVEVTVKKGDMLEKIARANGTTVQAIKEANKLPNDKLKIGQVLKIPIGGSGAGKVAEASKPAPASTASASAATPGEPVYYTVKSGDNPWKIAKQFGVKFEDILKLNNMTEEQSRKLQVGDKIRVK